MPIEDKEYPDIIEFRIESSQITKFRLRTLGNQLTLVKFSFQISLGRLQDSAYTNHREQDF